jgi:hypothetical protein
MCENGTEYMSLQKLLQMTKGAVAGMTKEDWKEFYRLTETARKKVILYFTNILCELFMICSINTISV